MRICANVATHTKITICMKLDTYIKGALTVIAACLVLLTANNLGLIPTAKADSALQTMPSTNEGYALVPINEDGSINVRVQSINDLETIDVNIDDISTSDKLNVNISSSNSYSLQYAGPIEVDAD